MWHTTGRSMTRLVGMVGFLVLVHLTMDRYHPDVAPVSEFPRFRARFESFGFLIPLLVMLFFDDPPVCDSLS